MEFTDHEKLFIAEAFSKKLDEIVDKKKPLSLRSQVDEEYRRKFEEEHVRSVDACIGDYKVGTYSVITDKATPEDNKTYLKADEPDKLLAWIRNGLEGSQEVNDFAHRYIKAHAVDFAEEYFLQTGEVPGGCNVQHVHVHAQPERYKYGRLHIEPEKVAQALGNRLEDATRLLLEGGNDAA